MCSFLTRWYVLKTVYYCVKANIVQLWKRRWVEIDSQGYIILKPPAEAVSVECEYCFPLAGR
jgi:hypothetical protein